MRHAIHKLICWYLRRCAGAFHCYNYGETGRYVVLMTDAEYHSYQKENSELRALLRASSRCSNDRTERPEAK